MTNTDTNRRRTAIVTGAGMGVGGVGRAIAGQLVREGYAVMVTDIDPEVERVAVSLAETSHAPVAFHVADLSVEGQAAELIDKTVQRFGGVDVMVNNAGGGIIRPFLEHDAASFAATLARNLWTTIWCCHKVLPHMIEQNHGRIINIGADSLRTGIPGHAGYNAAKGGVVGMTVALARDFAHLDITVNVVSPCVINTRRHQDMIQASPELRSAFLAVVPKGRSAELREVADVVSFLARRETAFVTGQEISVNGGSAMP